MKKTKCCLWGVVAICLSAGVPLYGDDSDDDEKPAPTVRKTFQEIVAAFPPFGKKELISDPRPRAYRIEEKIPRFDTVASRFNDITQLFKDHIGGDRPGLCRDVWERCCFTSKQGKEETKNVLSSWLFEECEVDCVNIVITEKKIRGFTRELRSIRFDFVYEGCDCECAFAVYKDTELRLGHIHLCNRMDGAYWFCDELR